MSFPAHSSDADVTEDPTFDTQDQIVLILCGLIASGKSTFAEALQHHYPQFQRCNQDDLGDRRRVEQLAYETLNEGLSVCIDRTNFNAPQRSYWIEIAREFPGTKIWAIVFDTPFETCAERLQTRTDHPTILNAEQGMSILTRFAADFQHPTMREGLDRILYFKPSDHTSPEYTRTDVASILRRVRDSPSVTQTARHNNTHQGYQSGSPFAGNYNRGRRGGHGWRESRDYTSQYQHGSRGRGGNHNHTNAGSSTSVRSWQSPPYRGNSVGIHGTRERVLPYPPASSRNPPNREQFPSQGRGTGEDPFVID